MTSSGKHMLTSLSFKSRYNVGNFESIDREMITIVGKLVLDSHFPVIKWY